MPLYLPLCPKRLFSMTEYERFGLVFTKTLVYKFGHWWCWQILRSIYSILLKAIVTHRSFSSIFRYTIFSSFAFERMRLLSCREDEFFLSFSEHCQNLHIFMFFYFPYLHNPYICILFPLILSYLLTREHWMIYRGLGFLAVVQFGSTPSSPPLSFILCVAGWAYWRERGGRESLALYK